MPIFSINKQKVQIVKPTKFKKEKELQSIVENNLEEIFNCRFIATEFSTGAVHAGRIDTLALSEENNPVIIEYKIIESSDLVNQSLFYLSWIDDHRGDFQVLVNDKLGSNQKVDWSSIRVICLAPGYKKYDLHAVKMMGANIELWKYRLYSNDSVLIEEITTNKVKSSKSFTNGKDPVMVEAGFKAAQTRKTGEYTYEQHLDNKKDKIQELADAIREFTMGLDDGVEEYPKKLYIAYKTTKNFLCMEVQKSKILIYLKINAKDLKQHLNIGRDVTNIGHFGTGNYEITLVNNDDLETAQEFIEESFKNIGG